MKVKTLRLFLILLVLSSAAKVRPLIGSTLITGPLKAITVIVNGKLLNDSTGKPVKNHSVIIWVPYIAYTSTVYTDTSGNYADTISSLPGLGDTLRVGIYDCHNILHIQSQSIQSYSIVVNFYICETFNPQCVSDFIAELDSSAVTPYRYKFFDLSTGAPDRWLYDFGDGTKSAERNPSHTYSKAGRYQVCLTVIRDNLMLPCSDSSCSFINTPRYYSIGGHMFCGEHPINNPASTGDTGVANLYKLYNNYVIPFDTLKFTYLGYYSFPHLLRGNYIVKVGLTPNSKNSAKYTPAYFMKELYWQQSQLLGVTDTSVFNFDVYLDRADDSSTGPGRISGRVEKHVQNSGIFSLYGNEVLLLDSVKNPVKYTLTGAAGEFVFPGLPFGNYLLFVESTGKFSKYNQVRISAESPVADTLVLDIYDHNVTGIAETIRDNDVVAGLPFPNPTAGKISVQLSVRRPVDLSTAVYSVQSVTLLQSIEHLIPGSHLQTIDLSGLSPGVFILVLKTTNGEHILTQKIIKY